MSENRNKKKIIWIELLRIMACIGVIGLHTGAQRFSNASVDSFEWAVSNFFHGINRFAVACFIMISGCLYLDGKRSWDLKKLWKRSILPVAVAYVFWQMFYAVYRIFTGGIAKQGLKASVIKFLVYISKSYFHLWYLPMLLGLLIITPMLWEIVNSSRGKQWEEYMIVLFLIFKIIPYTVNYFSLPWKEHIMNILNTVQPDMVISYVGYYIMGHYLSHYEIPKKLERVIYAAGVVLISAGLALCYFRSQQTGKGVQSFYENYTMAAFFWSTSFFLFFKNYVSKIQWNEKQERFITNLGSCTFGIYLIHALTRNALLRLFGVGSTMFPNTILAILVSIVLIFCISWAAVLLIKKIPVIGKWIV